MHRLLNLFCFPLFIIGSIFLSQGILGFNWNNSDINVNIKTSGQINNLYSEKEITLKDPPVDEILSEKLFVKIRIKPINPKIIMNIEDKKNISQNSNLSENDFNHLNSNKKDFVKTVLPLIISENQNILITRKYLTDLKNKLKTFKTLDNDEVIKIKNIAKDFNVKYTNKHKLDLIDELLIKVDIIPNSIALAQAAIESGWGSSRFAKDYNALFGEYTYDQDKGVVPLNRIDGAKHLIKSFSSYDNSVSSYFKNINSHNAYREFRNVRRIMRSKNNFSDINLLIKNLNSYAEDDNYINTLKIVIQKNNFNSFNSKTISY